MLLVFGDRISPEINTKVTAAADSLRERRIPGVTDLIPAYCSLLVQYDPLTISCESLRAQIGEILQESRNECEQSRRLIRIPVCYGGEYGPDLEHIAKNAGLAPETVIRIHSSRDYRVYMLGFLPVKIEAKIKKASSSKRILSKSHGAPIRFKSSNTKI
ncbi:MAG: carboxyltransferase domain-containing protein, partial [Clostridia bacterium]|nr:carboxyltransferase domain-containing protein [Clostridia bacterium]